MLLHIYIYIYKKNKENKNQNKEKKRKEARILYLKNKASWLDFDHSSQSNLFTIKQGSDNLKIEDQG